MSEKKTHPALALPGKTLSHVDTELEYKSDAELRRWVLEHRCRPVDTRLAAIGREIEALRKDIHSSKYEVADIETAYRKQLQAEVDHDATKSTLSVVQAENDKLKEQLSAVGQYITQLEQEIEKSATESHREAVGDERAALQGSVRRSVVRALRKRMKVTVTSTADDSGGRCSHPHGFSVRECEHYSPHDDIWPRSPTCAEHCIHWVTGEGHEQQNCTTEPDTDPGNKGLDSRKG